MLSFVKINKIFVSTSQSTHLPATEGGREGGRDGRSFILNPHHHPAPTLGDTINLCSSSLSPATAAKVQLGSFGGEGCIVAGALPPSDMRFKNISRCADGSPRRQQRAFDSFFFLLNATLFQPFSGNVRGQWQCQVLGRCCCRRRRRCCIVVNRLRAGVARTQTGRGRLHKVERRDRRRTRDGRMEGGREGENGSSRVYFLPFPSPLAGTVSPFSPPPPSLTPASLQTHFLAVCPTLFDAAALLLPLPVL